MYIAEAAKNNVSHLKGWIEFNVTFNVKNVPESDRLIHKLQLLNDTNITNMHKNCQNMVLMEIIKISLKCKKFS